MRFPIGDYADFSLFTTMAVAFLLGIGFGFFLERAGFGSARKLAAQFYLRDFSVLKVMFTAIVVAGIGFWWLAALGLLDLNLTFINPTLLTAQIVGGLILGVGFTIGGYCPGTSCVAFVTGRTDAIWHLAGMFFGMLVFSYTEPAMHASLATGDLGERFVWEWIGVSPGLVLLLAVLVAVGAFAVGTIVERKKKSVITPDRIS